jgi:hypothetical protein
MQPRRSLRLVAGALVLALPLLASCGFDKATDQVYTPGAGIDDRSGDVDILSAVIVSAQPQSGTFIATLSNNRSDKAFTLESIKGAGDWTDLTIDPSSLSIDIPARGFVNLVDEDPITVHGDITPGQVAEVTLTFDSGDAVTMDVPVVYACNYYEGLDSSASGSTASPSASPGKTASPSPTASPTSSGQSQEPYDCASVGEG